MLLAEKLLVVLRDGRKLIGILRSFDQFGTAPRAPGPSCRRACAAAGPLTRCGGPLRWTCMSRLAANLVLQDTIERIHVGNMFGDIERGIFLVRGENVVLMGEIVRHPLALPAAVVPPPRLTRSNVTMIPLASAAGPRAGGRVGIKPGQL